jgi:uncharacterized protein (TIGR03118 family)
MIRKSDKFSLVIGAFVAMAATFPAKAQFYTQTNLVSDISGMAMLTDPNLVNPWGVSHSPTSPFWVSDAGKNVSTLYFVSPTTGVVTASSLVVKIPGPPSGQVFNGVSTDFLLAPNSPALFIFAELNGTVSGWNPNVPAPGSNQAISEATGPAPAAYTGIALGTRSSGQFLFAANPAGSRIDVYDNTFTKVSVPGTFTDASLPAGDAPFNIANINGSLYVSYTGPTGVINVFDTDGNFIKRFATGGSILNPWGMVVAPSDFGMFANALLVGNFNRGNAANGPGQISAFDLSTGAFLGLLKGTDGAPLAIDGLWQLIFGNGGNAGNPGVLYFAAGIVNETHGLFGSLAACHGPVISGASASPNVLWPPNNKFVPVTINYSVADDCDAAPVCSLSVTNNEDGSNDAQVVDAHTVDLLASRYGKGSGRIYTVAISCQDKLPLSSSTSVTVTVPHDQGH